MATDPVLGNSDAGGENVETNADIPRSFKDMLNIGSDPEYLRQLASIPLTMGIAEAAFRFSRTCGPNERMVREGLEYLRMCLEPCRELELACNRNSEWPRSYRRVLFHVKHITWLYEFFEALHDTTGRMVQSLDPAMFLEVFYATMILFMIRHIYLNSESSQGISRPSVTEDGCSTTGSECLAYRPMMLILKISNKTLYELCDVVYGKNIFIGTSRPFYNPLTIATNSLPSLDSNDTLVGGLKRFIDLVELK